MSKLKILCKWNNYSMHIQWKFPKNKRRKSTSKMCWTIVTLSRSCQSTSNLSTFLIEYRPRLATTCLRKANLQRTWSLMKLLYFWMGNSAISKFDCLPFKNYHCLTTLKSPLSCLNLCRLWNMNCSTTPHLLSSCLKKQLKTCALSVTLSTGLWKLICGVKSV